MALYLNKEKKEERKITSLNAHPFLRIADITPRSSQIGVMLQIIPYKTLLTVRIALPRLLDIIHP